MNRPPRSPSVAAATRPRSGSGIRRVHVLAVATILSALALVLVWSDSKPAPFPALKPPLTWSALSAEPRSSWPTLVRDDLGELLRSGAHSDFPGPTHPYLRLQSLPMARTLWVVVDTESIIVSYGMSNFLYAAPITGTPTLEEVAVAYQDIGARDVADILHEADRVVTGKLAAPTLASLDLRFKAAITMPAVIEAKAAFIQENTKQLLVR